MDAQLSHVTPPTCILDRLNKIHSHMERLRGSALDPLNTMNFDGLLDELDQVCQHSQSVINTVVHDMMVNEEAFNLLLQLLNAADKETLSTHGLHALVQPLFTRHAKAADLLSNFV